MKHLQVGMKPWAVEPHFESNADPCFMFKHALFHAMKAAGKIAGAADEHDHAGATAGPKASFDGSGKYLADLVICAMKMATETGINLEDEVHARMKDKGAAVGSRFSGFMKGMDMTGSNTLLLNQTEIKKAVALYLETQVFSPEYMKNVEVSDVACNNSSFAQEWTIKLAEKQEPVPSK